MNGWAELHNVCFTVRNIIIAFMRRILRCAIQWRECMINKYSA